MMQKYVIGILCAVLLLFSIEDVWGQYAVTFSKDAQKSWVRAKKRLPVKLRAVTHYRFKDQSGSVHERTTSQMGDCVVIGKFVVTTQHVLTDSTKEEIADYLKRNGWIFTDLEILGERYEIEYEIEYEHAKFGDRNVLKVVFEDKESDIALLEFLKADHLPPSLPVKIGDPAKLDDGSFLIIGGSLDLPGKHFREGYVSSLAPFYPKMESPVADFRRGSYFGINMDIGKGDSGGPVFAITEKGDLEWVGIVVTLISPPADLFVILKADFVLAFIKEKTGIDLRAVHEKQFKVGQ